MRVVSAEEDIVEYVDYEGIIRTLNRSLLRRDLKLHVLPLKAKRNFHLYGIVLNFYVTKNGWLLLRRTITSNSQV